MVKTTNCKRKLIVNTGTLSSGGAERVLSILSKPFADAFDEVQYVMWLDARYPEIFYEIDPRVKIVRMSKESGTTKTWRQMWWFRQYVKREEPDVVLSFMVMVCFTVTASLLFTGIRQVVAERNDPRFFKKKWLRKLIDISYLSSDVKEILMQTEWNKFYFTNKNLLAKTSVIFNPIDIKEEMVGIALQTTKQDVVVSVGRLSRQKQQWILLESFAIFHQTHPTYKLVIYGEGEMRDSLLAQAEKLGIKDSFLLPGRSKHVLSDISSAKMFVMTSRYEGMSNALVEAMCIGLPCVSTKVSGATDLIEDKVNGFLVGDGNSYAIAEKMTLLANDGVEREQMGCNASEIYNKLNSNKVSQQWVDNLIYIMAK